MLDRLSNTISSVTVGTTDAASAEINFSCYSGGTVFIPASSALLTTLTWYAAEQPGGTYLAAYDEFGDAIVQTVVHTRAYTIPPSLFGCRAIKAVGNVAGTVAISLKG